MADDRRSRDRRLDERLLLLLKLPGLSPDQPVLSGATQALCVRWVIESHSICAPDPLPPALPGSALRYLVCVPRVMLICCAVALSCNRNVCAGRGGGDGVWHLPVVQHRDGETIRYMYCRSMTPKDLLLVCLHQQSAKIRHLCCLTDCPMKATSPRSGC